MTSRARFPAEWEPQAGVLLAWPHAATDWADRLADVESTYVRLVSEISRRQRALLCVPDREIRDRAERLLVAAGADATRIGWIEVAYDDTWLRDSGPITLCSPTDSPGFTLLDFRFTGWGGKFEASRDDALIGALHARGVFADSEHLRIEFALEGGAIETDGAGTLLTTWRCLRERHPDWTREALTAQLKTALRQQRVLWLDHGYLEGDDTDAHIDTLARFANPTTVVYQGCDDPDDRHHDELQAMAVELHALRDAGGAAYRCLALPWPRPILDGGRRLAASYANFLIMNGAVLMPAYDDPADPVAAAVLAEAFPGREIVRIPCRSLIWQNGSLHCITMQLPEGVLA